MFVSPSGRNPLVKTFHAWWVIKTEKMPQSLRSEIDISYRPYSVRQQKSIPTKGIICLNIFTKVDVASAEQLVVNRELS